MDLNVKSLRQVAEMSPARDSNPRPRAALIQMPLVGDSSLSSRKGSAWMSGVWSDVLNLIP